MNESVFVGKMILIGINFYNDDNELVYQFQTHGIIKVHDENDFFQIERSDETLYSIFV